MPNWGAWSEACAAAKTITNRFIAFIFSLMRYVTRDEDDGICACVRGRGSREEWIGVVGSRVGPGGWPTGITVVVAWSKIFKELPAYVCQDRKMGLHYSRKFILTELIYLLRSACRWCSPGQVQPDPSPSAFCVCDFCAFPISFRILGLSLWLTPRSKVWFFGWTQAMGLTKPDYWLTLIGWRQPWRSC